MIVEDEPRRIVALQVLLEENGFASRVAFRGGKVRESIAAQRPDLVLRDILLPAVDGFGVCCRIRENSEIRDMRIVFRSARRGQAHIPRGMDLGADAGVHKPFCNVELFCRIRDLLGCA